MPSFRAVECISSTAIVSASSGEWYTLLCHYLGLTFIAFINGFVNEKRNRSLFHVRDEAKFTARMSHEIRTPLNGVLGMMKELARDPGLSATQRALIDGMEVGFPCPLTTDSPFIAAHGPPSWMALSFNTVTFTGGGGGGGRHLVTVPPGVGGGGWTGGGEGTRFQGFEIPEFLFCRCPEASIRIEKRNS